MLMAGKSNYKPLNVINDKEQCPQFLRNYGYISMIQQIEFIKENAAWLCPEHYGCALLLLWAVVPVEGDFLLLFTGHISSCVSKVSEFLLKCQCAA